MPARLSLVTLGVRDVERSAAFYEALGWRRSSASVAGEVAFFGTAGGLLALYGEGALARDAGQEGSQAGGFRGVSLAINLEEREDVDRAFAPVRSAGGKVLAPPAPADWGGYLGYFEDPDGHLWEVAHNPSWPIGPDGRPALPQ